MWCMCFYKFSFLQITWASEHLRLRGCCCQISKTVVKQARVKRPNSQSFRINQKNKGSFFPFIPLSDILVLVKWLTNSRHVIFLLNKEGGGFWLMPCLPINGLGYQQPMEKRRKKEAKLLIYMLRPFAWPEMLKCSCFIQCWIVFSLTIKWC